VSLSLLDTHRTEASSLFLIGRDCYMTGDFKKATRYLKKAVMKAPENSEYADWLGRAYYRRAETSDPLSGVVMTKKARQAFERAVQLNGRNADALSDLFDYYLETPGVLGGGHDKAANVVGMMLTVDPSQAFFEQWKLAQRLPQLRSESF
jgi:cytochrome c-type biogenesis protein CcmH/NrfG